MEIAMGDDLAERLQRFVAAGFRELDPSARVVAAPRPGGMVEVAVISRRFEGSDSAAREALLWTVVRSLPREVHVRLTYSLLLAPDEAARYYRDLDRRAEPIDDASEPVAKAESAEGADPLTEPSSQLGS